jgi:hypothetical protein
MTFGEEISQLLIIIVALLVVLLGVNFWTKRGGTLNLPSLGNKGSNALSDTNIEDEFLTGNTGKKKSSVRGKGGENDGLSTADRLGERFNLTGKDAEAAARVLKRMLKQDEKFKNQRDH